MSYTEKKRQSVFRMSGGKCYYCGCDLDFKTFRMDHFKRDDESQKVAANLVPACPDCNIAKNDMDIEQFRERLQTTVTEHLFVRLATKYFHAVPEKVTFYFERENQNDRT